jgi:hypothetical protein
VEAARGAALLCVAAGDFAARFAAGLFTVSGAAATAVSGFSSFFVFLTGMILDIPPERNLRS